ncbi:MAG TPA: metalloregulator ArsR/SmtB family transcription factor [Bacillota bacterium]|nr:metalloregulator ArsR/SmtB family transcription factor [Bacillota bacterium]
MKQIDLARIFKALSNEQRLKLFKMLYEWNKLEEGVHPCSEGVEKCFTKACCSLVLSRSTISHHFKELENAGLITVTRNGQSFICKINCDAVEAIQDFLR